MHDRIAREHPHSSTGQASEQPISDAAARMGLLRRADAACQGRSSRHLGHRATPTGDV